MTDPGGGAARRPLVAVDHVLVAVRDLNDAASRFEREHGLVALPGGRHPGAGTANMIIPLGSTYIELIAVVDESEAQTLPRSRRVAEALEAGGTFAAWAARTEDMDGLRVALEKEGWDLPPVNPGTRVRPDGVRLEWRTQELVAGAAPSVLPFVIEWRVPAGSHPAEAAATHPSGAGDIVALRFTSPSPEADEAVLRRLVGGALEVAVAEGERARLVAVELASPGQRMRLQ